MAIPRDRKCCRQKICLVLSLLLLLAGLGQLGLGIFFALKSTDRQCPRVKHMLIGVYLVIAGICGLANYSPKRKSWKTRWVSRSRVLTALFVLFCGLYSVVVVLDNNALNCVAHRSQKESDRMVEILGLVEVTGMHLAHLLSALCVGLAFPDLASSESGSLHKSEKTGSCGSKNKGQRALHLPEARTHVQEAPGTGEKVTVVSLPETDGIIYAVPEDQYVIRRGDATYMAPIGNTNLTAFFPTYRNSNRLI